MRLKDLTDREQYATFSVLQAFYVEKVQKTVDGPPGEEVELEGILVGRR